MAPLVAIIDDDVGIRNALRALMRSASYRAQTFPSAEEFVASEAASRSDCVVTDVAMQGMGGFELAGLLKSRGWTVPVILISALTDADLELKAIINGATRIGSRPPTTKIISQLDTRTISAAIKPPTVLPTEMPALIRITSWRGLRFGA